MECKKEANLQFCDSNGCSYTSCGKRGICCECIQSHVTKRQLPGCCFPPDAEKTYDRSFEKFAEAWGL